jgi:YggT family protein
MTLLGNILALIVQVLSQLFLLAILLRFVFQLVKADFYNPFSQAIVKATSPVLSPLRRVIPGFKGLDIASLVLALVVQTLAMAATLLFKGFNPLLPFLPIWAAISVIAALASIIFFAAIVSIISSWIAPFSQHPLLLLARQISDPAMAPFRKIIPPLGGLDLSPIFLFLSLSILQQVIVSLAVNSYMPQLLAGFLYSTRLF